MDASAALPLSGVRVLDLTRLLPGPYATFVLTGYGADVVKVEDTGAGDYARHSPPLKSSGLGAAFTASNAGKRSVAIDLKSAEGRELFLRLLRNADVLVESFRPGVMKRLGLDYVTLVQSHPRLIYCAMSGYGQHAAQAALAGHDINYQGEAGLLTQRTDSEVEPLPPALLGDLVGGSYSAVIAIMAALLERHTTGRGRFIDISITHGAMALLPFATIAAANGEAQPEFGQGALTGGNPFYGIYACADGRRISLGALEHKFWQAFCRHAGLDDLASLLPEKLHGDASTRAAVRERLTALFMTRSAADWTELGRQWDVCLGPVATVEEALTASHAQGLPLTHRYAGPKGMTVQVLKGVSADLAAPARELSPPPAQGQHTRALLAEAGCTAQQIDYFTELGVIRHAA
ncbi:CoA transferase [Variovorax humicola]|uniref:CoA transferase n=1 Tax=Variovorax humicola TaxID=1769758 RepID=A0ABU8W3W0_9BURK